MKRILSIFLCAVMLVSGMSISIPVSAADGAPAFYLEPVSLDDGQLVVNARLDNTAAYVITQLGLLVDYSDNISLTDSEWLYNTGTNVSSETIDTKPYMLLWVGGRVSVPGTDMEIVKLTFDVSGLSGDDTVTMSLSAEPDNLPADYVGYEYTDITYEGMEYTYAELDYMLNEAEDLPPVIEREGFFFEAVPEESDEDTLVFNIYASDINRCGIAAYGLSLEYSDNLALVACDNVYSRGMFVTSDSMDARPFNMYWVGGTTVLPYTETVVARVEFDIVGSLDDGIYFDLSYEPDEPALNINNEVLSTSEVPVMEEKSCSYPALVSVFPQIHTGATLVLEQSYQAGNELVVDMYLENDVGTDFSGFSAKMNYPEYLALKESEYVAEKGTYVFSENIDEKPYVLSTVIGTSVFPYGRTHIARYTFEIVGGVTMAEDEITLYTKEAIDLDDNDIKNSLISFGTTFDPSTALKSVRVSEMPAKTEYFIGTEDLDITGAVLELEYWDNSLKYVDVTADMVSGFDNSTLGENTLSVTYNGCTADFKVSIIPLPIEPGDVNEDENVNLADVSLMLRYIANWDVEINTDAGDVNDDGMVNLSDASLVLQYIANWDVELK